MKTRKTLTFSAAAWLGAGLAGCGGGDNGDSPTVVPAGDTIALTASSKLSSFNRSMPSTPSRPSTLIGSAAVRGLQSGESLLGIDSRPADGSPYTVSSAGRVYPRDPSTGLASPKATLAADAADTTSPDTAPAAADRFAIDFNPTVDRLRVISSSGQNLRVNVDTGATTTDDAIHLAGGTAALVAADYTNSFDGGNATQLFDLNAADGNLDLQNPPNNGVPGTPLPLAVSFGSTRGFDIDPLGNTGCAALSVGGATRCYAIDLGATANAATLIGAVGGGEAVVGLALNGSRPTPTVPGLTTDNRLIAFSPRTPNTIASTVTIGVPAGEPVVGIDIRPVDGAPYAVTRASGNVGRIYTVNPASAAVAAVSAVSVPLWGTAFSIDFNPADNALRVVGDSGQSLAVNLTTAPSTATVNGAVNLAGVASPVVAGAACLNSGVSTTLPAATTLYGLDAATDVLTTQAVATGTLIRVGALGRDISGAAGFDIGDSRNGLALAAFGSGGTHALYHVNLGSGSTAPPRGSTADGALTGGAGAPALRDPAIRF